jgi:hypothetical protein
MAIFLALLAAAFYFGQRWRVDAYRAWKRAQRVDYGCAAVTTKGCPR